MRSTCLISLGANLGDCATTFETAVSLLETEHDFSAVSVSRFITSTPAGGPAGQQPFLNGAAIFETTATAGEVLGRLHDVEAKLGRERTERWGARTLDLDLLLYGETIITKPNLRIPHPRMAWRRFVLEPAAEIGGEMIHPTTGLTVAELLRRLDRRPHVISLRGDDQAEVEAIAREAARKTGAEVVTEPAALPGGRRIIEVRDSKSPCKSETHLLARISNAVQEQTQTRIPILHLKPGNADWAIEEIAAAFIAME